MMHSGLSHFVGRGLPTIWCSINADITDRIPVVRSPFTEQDSEVIRLWARRLDEWLVRYNGAIREWIQQPRKVSSDSHSRICQRTVALRPTRHIDFATIPFA